MAILFYGLVWCQLFEPNAVVMMQTRLIVIDEYRGRNVHGVNKNEPFFDSALAQTLVHLRRNVDERHPCRCIEPKFFAIRFHVLAPTYSFVTGSVCTRSLTESTLRGSVEGFGMTNRFSVIPSGSEESFLRLKSSIGSK